MILTGNETDRIITENQIGYYKVSCSDPLRGEQVFLNKHQALIYATETQSPISYHWFDDAFNNAIFSTKSCLSFTSMNTYGISIPLRKQALNKC